MIDAINHNSCTLNPLYATLSACNTIFECHTNKLILKH